MLTLNLCQQKNNHSKNIAFIQICTKDGFGDYSGKEESCPPNVDQNIITKEGAFVDTLLGEDDPFYGAKWDEEKGEWIDESSTCTPGHGYINGMDAKAATMTDAPRFPAGTVRDGRWGEMFFITIAYSIDTNEVLGYLRWGFRVPPYKNMSIQLWWARPKDFKSRGPLPPDAINAIRKWNKVMSGKGHVISNPGGVGRVGGFSAIE